MVYPKTRRSAPCPPNCTCRKHVRRPHTAETRAKLSERAKERGFNHAPGCACVWCGSNPATIKHGEAARRSPEYVAWQNMIARCTRPTHPRYADWGGRGITVCDRWLVFENFLADLGRRPSDKHSLDRIDNSGDYEPGNCRWATRSEQQYNRRRPRKAA